MALFTLLFALWYQFFINSAACTNGDDLTCSLGGKCINNKCECDPTWTGVFCDVLDLLPSDTYKALYRSTESSWGGSVVYSNNDNLYHMFAADMAYNCTLSSWQSNSRVIHATSNKANGPYTYQTVTIPIFSHNPTVHQLADQSGYFIYHIGTANSKSGWKNCSSPNSYFKAINDYEGLPNEAFTSNINGIWTNHVSSGGGYAYNNPAAYVYSNGSILLVYKYGNSTFKAFALATSSAWNKPFKNVKHLPNLQGEDAYIWRDPNGYFHLLFHTYPHKHGATAYSKDGFEWYLANRTEAFPNYYTLLNGTHINVARRERHQVLLDDNGWPQYLFNGIEPEGSVNDFTYTGVQPINNTI